MLKSMPKPENDTILDANFYLAKTLAFHYYLICPAAALFKPPEKRYIVSRSNRLSIAEPFDNISRSRGLKERLS